MAHLMKDQAIPCSYSDPLFNHEPNDDRTPNEHFGSVTPSKNANHLDSTCITPILVSCSSTGSQRSSLSVTPLDSNLTTYLTPRSSLTPDTTFGDSTAAEYFSFATDSDELNETVTNSTVNLVYETCIGASARLLEATRLAQATRSVRQRLRPLRQASSDFLSRISKLQHLSIVRASQIDIHGEQSKNSEHNCTCKAGLFDNNCLKTFMEMSVQPAEYRNNSQMMTSTPMITKDVYEHGIFNVTRIKKVELHDLSPKLPDFHVIDATSKDRCINNNNVRTPNGNHKHHQKGVFASNITAITPIRTNCQHQVNSTVTMPSPEDGSVLKKVISFTFDQMNNADGATEKAARPSFVPEKLHFSANEQFKGQLFVKWVSSSIAKSLDLNEIDLNTVELLISGVCTHLIAAGVMKQIVTFGEPKNVFCPNEMYQWTHIDLKRQRKNEPKRDGVQNLYGFNSEFENEKMNTLISNGQEDSFASVKTKLLSHELAAETNAQPNGIDSINSDAQHEHKDQMKSLGNVSSKIDCADHLENVELKSDCDNKLKKIYAEISTQTDDIVDSTHKKEKAPEPLKLMIPLAAPPPPPPPPPPLPPASPFIFPAQPTKTTNYTTIDKPILPDTPTSSHSSNQSVTAQSATILSSASSFCVPPPPPMNGIPGPPPLPLPTGNMWFKSDTLRKAAKHPPKPMINLFWTRILIPKDEEEENVKPKVDTSTMKKREKLWQKIDETILENADDFTELFARQATPKRPREVSKMPKKTVIKVLDHKRSQSVGIFSQSLYRHRIDSQVIQKAIYNWDLSNIGLDLLQQMLEHRATADELKAIKEALKSATTTIPLDGPENFLLKFSEISCAPERIACIIFRNEFEEANVQIEQKIKTITNLCEFLMDNDHLSDLFAIILTLGNFMNGGNRYRGQADGFGLDVLNKLKDVKSKDKKITLLHFIVRTFISKRRQNGLKPKEIIYPVPDADDVKSASTVDFDVLNEQIEQLRKNLEDIKQKMSLVITASTEQNMQPFKNISEEFVQIATNKIDYQFQQLKACKVIFRETLDYFKHIPKTGTIDECTPSQFFELWANFSIDFRDFWRKELAAINAEIIQKYKSIASPKTPQNRSKGKQKPTGLRVRRVNQI